MADSSGENIGGINVSITGDYSPLQAAFSTAQDLASQAGGNIADALTQGAASAGSIGDEIAGQLGQIPPAADGAAGSLQGFAGSAGDAGEAAGASTSSLAEMAEKLTAIGEALVITEGLKEFGTEALSAADSVTTASISLTKLTGDAGAAEETMRGLDELGTSDGLSMPALRTAATRMTALLPEGTDVVAVLGQIADGAAVTGTSIEQAANRFDMIVNAGTLSARALTSMGLSLTAVTAAMNQLDPALQVTEQHATAAFKALDPGDRIQVLQTALQGLGGTAQQVAEQTFGGQWQQLANAWEEVMVQVGQAILPVISDLISITKTDIIPFVSRIDFGFFFSSRSRQRFCGRDGIGSRRDNTGDGWTCGRWACRLRTRGADACVERDHGIVRRYDDCRSDRRDGSGCSDGRNSDCCCYGRAGNRSASGF